ncbi:MAG: NAD(P)/FAD-dependent oxidoreductase [Magnetococcales bacterium]|nr:NAD(P)/FAD-dependent oxidoreductase [Magnetococcales bacterium]
MSQRPSSASRQIIIVGGGPSGAMAAWRLAQARKDVLLLEAKSFPRFKPCAGWVTPKALATLEIDPLTYPHLLIPISQVAIALDGDLLVTSWPQPVSYGVLRSELDDFLLKRARAAGADVRFGQRVDRVEWLGSRVSLQVGDEHWISEQVIGAGGSSCPVARAVEGRSLWKHRPMVAAIMSESPVGASRLLESSLGTGMPVLFPEPECDGYGWYFAKGDFLNLGVGALLAGGLAIPQRHKRFLQSLARDGTLPDSWTLSPFVGHSYAVWRGRRTHPAGPHYLLTGDAAGLAHDFSGEGIGPAALSGSLAAAALIHPDSVRGYQDYNRRIALIQGNGPLVRTGAWVEKWPLFVRRKLLARLCRHPWTRRRWILEGAFLHGLEP